MPGFRISLTGSWAEARRRYAEAQRDARKRLVLAIRRAAILLEKEIKQGLTSGAPGGQALRPLALSTILQRKGGGRGAKPLLDTGELRASIHHSVDEANLRGFVGIHRGARDSAGGDLVQLAAVHEFGSEPFAITVTDDLRRFFVWLSIASGGRILPLRKDTTVIYHPGVPARPFIRPSVERARPLIERELRVSFEG